MSYHRDLLSIVVLLMLVSFFIPPLGGLSAASANAEPIAIVLDRIERKIIQIDSAGTVTNLHSNIGVNPIGFTVDAAGNFIVVDTNHAQPGLLLKVTPQGSISTMANVGTDPAAIVVDMQGNYIIVDGFEQKVLKVTPTGTITTIATLGNPPQPGVTATSGLVDIEIDANGDYVVLDNGGGVAGRIFKVTPSGVATTVVSELGVDPFGLAIDSNGNYIVVDDEAGPGGSGVVFKVTPSGLISQIATNLGTHPHEIVIETSGNFLVVDPASGSLGDLYRVTPSGTIQLLLQDFSQEPVDILIPAPQVIAAVVDIDPDTLNLKSKGKYITAYIELSDGFDVNDIDVSTVVLKVVISGGTFPALASPTEVGDHDGDGIPDLAVKFDRSAIIEHLKNNSITGNIEFMVSGKVNGVTFEGTDAIRVI